MKKLLFYILALSFSSVTLAQNMEPFEVTEEWILKIENLAPATPTVKNVQKKKLLVFSKATGFYHWAIPQNNEMLKILAKKSNLFEIHIGYDVENFTRENLKKYDAVILNNSNPKSDKRDLFWDLLKANTTLNDEQIAKEAEKYEDNLIDYVAKGGGLMLLHGAIVVQNNSLQFSKMTGGSFDYHPKQQEIHVKEVDVDHPLVRAFKGKGLTHIDEPYFFKNAYFDYNFRPLLYFDVDDIAGVKHEPSNKTNYVAWIKRHGKGRIFYSAPSHNAQSLENPELLQFFLDGMQYVVGDFECDDSPLKIETQ